MVVDQGRGLVFLVFLIVLEGVFEIGLGLLSERCPEEMVYIVADFIYLIETQQGNVGLVGVILRGHPLPSLFVEPQGAVGSVTRCEDGRIAEGGDGEDTRLTVGGYFQLVA